MQCLFSSIFQNFNKTTSKYCNMKMHLLILHIYALQPYARGSTAQFTIHTHTHTETTSIYLYIFLKTRICHLAHKKPMIYILGFHYIYVSTFQAESISSKSILEIICFQTHFVLN